MPLEQVFECPRTLKKLRSGSLGGLMDSFCDGLLKRGFRRGTVRRHLSNVAHLNAYLTTRKWVEGQSLSAQHVGEFLRDYPSMARNRRPLGKPVAGIKASVNRLVDYLRTSGRFEALAETAIYQPLWRHISSGWRSTNMSPLERLSSEPILLANSCAGWGLRQRRKGAKS